LIKEIAESHKKATTDPRGKGTNIAGEQKVSKC
jgi:hypothetical protein